MKRAGKFIVKVIVVLLVTLVMFEGLYRYQWLDFYSSEWTYLNKNTHSTKGKKNILVFGDSFTAGADSWVTKWNRKSTTHTIYNASMPGVGVETYRLIQGNRMKEVKPQKVVVQLYVGNDLYDIEKPVNWNDFSVGRNLFWLVSNNFRVLNFCNYKLGQISQDVVSDHDPKADTSFVALRYSARTKLYIQGDVNYPSAICNLEGGHQKTFAELVAMLTEMKNELPENCSFHIVVIPHCVQVHGRYQQNYATLGAVVDPELLSKNKWSTRLLEEGFDVIDPLTCFRAEEKRGNKLYFDNDPHLTSEGQQILSELVSKHIRE